MEYVLLIVMNPKNGNNVARGLAVKCELVTKSVRGVRATLGTGSSAVWHSLSDGAAG